MEKADYTFPVRRDTVDTMIETLVRENNRLSQENQKLREQLGKQDGTTADPQNTAEEMRKAMESYM